VTRGVALSVALLVAATASSCAGTETVAVSDRPRTYSPADLKGLVLRPDEGPEGTRFIEGGSGTLTLKRFWPSSCCPSQQQAFAEAGFVAGYGVLFERPGRSGEPIDTRPGFEQISSRVALFRSEAGASEAMAGWIEFQDAGEMDPLPGRGLGQETGAFVGNPDAPAETVVLYVWRMGRLLLYLRASVGTGTVPVEQVRALADRMDRRAS
jgi:hypothetical protein